MADERSLLLEEELLIVRHSGEIPEIALHSTLYYLQNDPEGPQIELNTEELMALQEATLERSKEIVLRDLNPKNRDLGIYRGIRRSIYNWHRLQAFCRRSGCDCPEFQRTVVDAVRAFLLRELQDVESGERVTSVNCRIDELVDFVRALDCDPETLPSGWQTLCLER